ncbi:MAG TPA: ABC transporter permease [Planctomycetaceae bacterium]|jgi:lipopolysaccharide transport system permease protein
MTSLEGTDELTLDAESMPASPAALAERDMAGSTTRAPAPPDAQHLLTLRPTSGWRAINVRELWRFRELAFFLAWRDVKVRYKQTVLGAAWAVIQPVMTMVVFSVFFGRLGGMSQHVDQAYPIFVYSALLPWTFFSGAVSQCGGSLIQSERLISKVYFPRLLIPFAAVGAALVDFAISFAVMGLMMFYYGVAPTANLLLLPALVLATALSALGAGTLLASLSVAYRDFRHVIPFLVQIWMFVSPVAYPLKVVPASWRLAYALNPMAGIIGGYRAALLGEAIPWDCLAVSFAAALALFGLGLMYFRRVERRFADIV